MTHARNLRTHLITLALLAACSAASAVTVDSDPLVTYSNQYNNVILSPTSPSPYRDQRTNEDDWTDSALTITNDQASVTRGTATSTAGSTSSGTLSGDMFTTASWARAYSDSTGGTGANSDAVIDNAITFTVSLLSNYSWSALFDVVDDSNDNRLSTDPYFQLFDASYNLIFGCYPCADGSLSGSGTLLAGIYVLAWGGSASATSTTVSPIGWAEFTQSGSLTLTAASVPEPGTLALLGLGLAGLGLSRRRKTD